MTPFGFLMLCVIFFVFMIIWVVAFVLLRPELQAMKCVIKGGHDWNEYNYLKLDVDFTTEEYEEEEGTMFWCDRCGASKKEEDAEITYYYT